LEAAAWSNWQLKSEKETVDLPLLAEQKARAGQENSFALVAVVDSTVVVPV
jgi:hypothetical protein